MQKRRELVIVFRCGGTICVATKAVDKETAMQGFYKECAEAGIDPNALDISETILREVK